MYNDVLNVYEKGLMTGTSETIFEPNLETSCAMLVAVLYRLEGEPDVSGGASFSDVSTGDWYTEAVHWAAKEGIVTGFNDGTFGPNQSLTREQTATILYRYAEAKGMDVSARADVSGFKDAASISPYAQEALEWAKAIGLMSGVGDNQLDPKGKTTRAQMAALLTRFEALV